MNNNNYINNWTDDLLGKLDVPLTKSKEDLLSSTLASAGLDNDLNNTGSVQSGKSTLTFWSMIGSIVCIAFITSVSLFNGNTTNKVNGSDKAMTSSSLIGSERDLLNSNDPSEQSTSDENASQDEMGILKVSETDGMMKMPKEFIKATNSPFASVNESFVADPKSKLSDEPVSVPSEHEKLSRMNISLVTASEAVPIVPEFRSPDHNNWLKESQLTDSTDGTLSDETPKDKHMWLFGVDGVYTRGISNSLVTTYKEQRQLLEKEGKQHVVAPSFYISRRLINGLYITSGLTIYSYSQTFNHDVVAYYSKNNNTEISPGVIRNDLALIKYENRFLEYFQNIEFTHTIDDNLIQNDELYYSVEKIENRRLVQIPVSLDYYYPMGRMSAYFFGGILLNKLAIESKIGKESIRIEGKTFVPESRLIYQKTTSSERRYISPMAGVGVNIALNARWNLRSGTSFNAYLKHKGINYQIAVGINYKI